MKKSMKWVALISLASLLSFNACALGPESNSGDDKDRLGAIEFKINDLVLDHVSCLDGDKTDWKYFTVPYETRVAVTFAFDQAAANGKVIIRKATGEEMYRLAFVPGSRMTQEFMAVPGHYYLEIFCESFESEYTVEVSIPN